MKRSMFETILGAVVLFIAAIFIWFSYSVANIRQPDGYMVTARFNKIGGLTAGNDVRISGVKVGTVKNIALDPHTFQAITTLSLDAAVSLPVDTVAQVNAEGLLGGNYLNLTPGVDEDRISNGGRIDLTQPPVDFLDMIGRFIFSANDGKGAASGDE